MIERFNLVQVVSAEVTAPVYEGKGTHHGSLNRTGFVGGLIPREDGAHGTTEQVLPGAA